MIKIAVFTNCVELIPEAQKLAENLNIPFGNEADFLLILTPQFLGLQNTQDKSKPLFIDFSSKQMNYRIQQKSVRQEAIIRAMKLKQNQPTHIVDATGGLGKDSFILASFGLEVEIIERSPIIHTLLENGMKRGLNNEIIAPIIKKMTLIHQDARLYLSQMSQKPDIIYLDPMFPKRKKTALTNLTMRHFHLIVGDDPDAQGLLEIALACATKRVVVKRPRHAKPLSEIKPSYFIEGKSSRFDIYL